MYAIVVIKVAQYSIMRDQCQAVSRDSSIMTYEWGGLGPTQTVTDWTPIPFLLPPQSLVDCSKTQPMGASLLINSAALPASYDYSAPFLS